MIPSELAGHHQVETGSVPSDNSDDSQLDQSVKCLNITHQQGMYWTLLW
jgi:hypothetical protein